MAYEKKLACLNLEGTVQVFHRGFSTGNKNREAVYPIFYGTVEILVCLGGVLFGIALLPIVLLGNLLANPGKLLYTQERIGVRGKKFQILKFRTMRCISESEGVLGSPKNVCRTTLFGKFLRKSHLDEIPQFYNILKGEMRLIGPRPERPLVVKEFSRTMLGYDLRHRIKPGLTGWAQVKVDYGDSALNEWEKLQYDLHYIENRSLLLDLHILLKTFLAVILLRGE